MVPVDRHTPDLEGLFPLNKSHEPIASDGWLPLVRTPCERLRRSYDPKRLRRDRHSVHIQCTAWAADSVKDVGMIRSPFAALTEWPSAIAPKPMFNARFRQSLSEADLDCFPSLPRNNVQVQIPIVE